MLRATPEASGLMRLFLGSTADPAARPALRLTYVPALGLGER
jgi:hypothetical protein